MAGNGLFYGCFSGGFWPLNIQIAVETIAELKHRYLKLPLAPLWLRLSRAVDMMRIKTKLELVGMYLEAERRDL